MDTEDQLFTILLQWDDQSNEQHTLEWTQRGFQELCSHFTLQWNAGYSHWVGAVLHMVSLHSLICAWNISYQICFSSTFLLLWLWDQEECVPSIRKRKNIASNQGKKKYKPPKIYNTGFFPLLMRMFFCTSVFCYLILFKKLSASSRWPL